jgi:hypothetical protein
MQKVLGHVCLKGMLTGVPSSISGVRGGWGLAIESYTPCSQ